MVTNLTSTQKAIQEFLDLILGPEAGCCDRYFILYLSSSVQI
jgi:hypothetical protein